MFRTQDDSYGLYPIELPVRYEIQERDGAAGQGRTTAMSSEMVRFECDRKLPRDRKVRLVLAWPAALPDGTELNLWIQGTVERCALGKTDVRVIGYEFRTRRMRPMVRVEQPMPSRHALYLLKPLAGMASIS
jgi:hypothetical protein